MIITDRMVFLHLHKSGGTFVNSMLRHCIPSARRVGYHFPYREIPAAMGHLPVMGTVRSPWAYYVSWFHFQVGLPQPNPLFRIVSDSTVPDFTRTVTNLLLLAGDETRLSALANALPNRYRPGGLNLIKADISDLRKWGGGFYSFLYQRLYAGAVAPTIMRTEHLRDELRVALEAVGHLPNACISSFLAEAPPLNTSTHADPATYFDPKLAKLVADRDRHVLDRHGYALTVATC